MSAAMFAKLKELTARVEALEMRVKQLTDERAKVSEVRPVPLGLPKKSA